MTEGDSVRLLVRYTDGPHGVEIKEFRVKKAVPRAKPGDEPVAIEFVASKAGTFTILCSEYCGNGHKDMTGSLVVAIGLAILCYGAFRSVISVEEGYLEHVFGDAYRQYMKEVPRFFPNPALFRESELLSVRPQLLYRTFVDGLMFLAAYPFFELVEHLQDAGILPVILVLF